MCVSAAKPISTGIQWIPVGIGLAADGYYPCGGVDTGENWSTDRDSGLETGWSHLLESPNRYKSNSPAPPIDGISSVTFIPRT